MAANGELAVNSELGVGGKGSGVASAGGTGVGLTIIEMPSGKEAVGGGVARSGNPYPRQDSLVNGSMTAPQPEHGSPSNIDLS